MTRRIEVTTYHMESRASAGTDYESAQWVRESIKQIDYDNSSDRKWLAKHCWWAMRNGRRVTTNPVGDSYDSMILLGRIGKSINDEMPEDDASR